MLVNSDVEEYIFLSVFFSEKTGVCVRLEKFYRMANMRY